MATGNINIVEFESAIRRGFEGVLAPAALVELEVRDFKLSHARRNLLRRIGSIRRRAFVHAIDYENLRRRRRRREHEPQLLLHRIEDRHAFRPWAMARDRGFHRRPKSHAPSMPVALTTGLPR